MRSVSVTTLSSSNSSTFNSPLQLLHHFRLAESTSSICKSRNKQKMTQKKTSNLQLHMQWRSLEDNKTIRMAYCGIPPSMTHSDDVHEENGNKMQENWKAYTHLLV